MINTKYWVNDKTVTPVRLWRVTRTLARVFAKLRRKSSTPSARRLAPNTRSSLKKGVRK